MSTLKVKPETAPEIVTRNKSRLHGARLAMLGVRLRNRFGEVLECDRCHEQWSPEYNRDGSLQPGFWRCPNRCNW